MAEVTPADSPAAKTAQEMRDQFLDGCRTMVDYWASPQLAEPNTVHDRLSGLLHSILAIIDGSSSTFPCALDLVCRPHPDDQQWHLEQGERWVADGTVLNEDDLLTELLYHRGRWEPEPALGGSDV